MKLESVMLDLIGGTASLGLFGDLDEETVRPPHVQVTLAMTMMDGTSDELRRRAIESALDALEAARDALKAEL